MPLRPASVLRDAPAVVLAGGLGTRLHAAFPGRPKVLAPARGVPFLGRLLEHLAADGVRDVVLCTGHRAEDVEAFAGNGDRWGLGIRYSVEAAPLGTGGALKNAQSLIDSDRFLALNGDSFVKTDLAPFLKEHVRTGASATVLLVRVEDRSRFGSVRVSEDNRVLAFEEKGAAGRGLINAGVYVLEHSILDRIAPAGFVSLETDVLPDLVGDGLFGFAVDAPFLDIGTPESLAEAQRFFA